MKTKKPLSKAQLLREVKTIMKHSEFIELVREMRFNQRQYFKHRTQGFLEKSKALEKQVDQYLADSTAKSSQQTLF